MCINTQESVGMREYKNRDTIIHIQLTIVEMIVMVVVVREVR